MRIKFLVGMAFNFILWFSFYCFAEISDLINSMCAMHSHSYHDNTIYRESIITSYSMHDVYRVIDVLVLPGITNGV